MNHLSLILGAVLAFVTVSCTSLDQLQADDPPSQHPNRLEEQILQRQIFLDGEGFGSGVVDGQDGEFTRKAVLLYQQAKGLSPDALNQLEEDIQTRVEYSVTEKDLSALVGSHGVRACRAIKTRKTALHKSGRAASGGIAMTAVC